MKPLVAPIAREVSAEGSALHVTLADGASVADVVAALVGAGARVAAVQRESRSLEEAYLALVGGDA